MNPCSDRRSQLLGEQVLDELQNQHGGRDLRHRAALLRGDLLNLFRVLIKSSAALVQVRFHQVRARVQLLRPLA